MTKIEILLLVIMTLASVWTVMGRSLLKATIGLALTSAVIAALMFRLDSPLAAVFELSVCTGLMTVIFVSTISLTKPLTHKEIIELSRDRFRRFWYLPVILVICGAAMIFFRVKNELVIRAASGASATVQEVLWNMRQLDLFGQILVIVIGALGVVTLFEERRRDEW